MKSLLINTSLAIFALLLCLFFAEITLRVLPQQKAGHWYDRPKYFYNPAQSRTLQALTHSPKKPANTFRIAIIGDSFSFAPFMQFDDAFPRRLERMMALNVDHRPVEVINYSVPGYSTTHELKEVERALAEEADVIVLQVTLNDPEIKLYRPKGMNVKANPYGAYVPEVDGGFFAHHSRVIQWFEARWHVRASFNLYKNYFFKLYENRKAVTALSSAYKKASLLARDKNVPICAVVFPLFGTPIDSTYPFRPIHERIHELLDREKIPYFDLLPVFEGIPPERLQVMPGEDFHPNEIGHRIAAEEIFVWLSRSGFVPPQLTNLTAYQLRTQILLQDGKPILPRSVLDAAKE